LKKFVFQISKGEKMRKLVVFLALASFLWAGSAHAAKYVWVKREPPFDTRDIDKVAVVEFENRSRHPEAGGRIAARVESLLIEDGHYKVVHREELLRLMHKRKVRATVPLGLKDALDVAQEAGVDAIITGTVIRYMTHRWREVYYEESPYYEYGYRRRGWRREYYVKRPYRRPYWVAMIEAVVDVELEVVKATTGEVLWRGREAATWRGAEEEVFYDVDRALFMAAEPVLRSLVSHIIGVTERAIVPHDSLSAARRLSASGIFEDEDDFSIREENLYLVVKLSPAFYGKELFIIVEHRRTKKKVAELGYIWGTGEVVHRFPLSINEIASRGGFGDYRARYFIDGQEIDKVDIEIKGR
jgi:hypothetical protein